MKTAGLLLVGAKNKKLGTDSLGSEEISLIEGTLTLREAYDSINWSIILLLGIMIPLGQALERSGGTELIAELILKPSSNISPIFIIMNVMAITLLLTKALAYLQTRF